MSLLEITWTDPVTGRHGYVVIDSLIGGMASGGLRLRAGCTLDEVRGLAQGMARKEAIVYDPRDRYQPFGGAKGGIDVDPRDPEASAVLRRFIAAVRPVIREQWNTGEDFGVRQELLDQIAAELGLESTVEAVFSRIEDAAEARTRLAAGFAVDVDGIGLADLVGGFGVAQAGLSMLRRSGLDPATATAVVQGFGSIGGAAARHLAASGVRVVAIADREGLIRNDAGLDVEALLRSRDGLGVVDRGHLRPDDEKGDRDDWLAVPCDLLVPAAMSYVIDRAAVDRMTARIVVEGANMPTLPDAETALAARGVPVVPDFLANVMTNAWWWWVVFGDVAPDASSAFEKIAGTMSRLVETVANEAATTGVSLREAAQTLADRNAAAAKARLI
ncbi:Glu/Leu/Phe/Val dehydrogenase dimerization domain-containing protein [Pseudonocardia sp. TRM90224]|uniref:Glu/Leu/Phe/Val dehydrogenase dimerization domain-containing protein n=1 Tax=Pseudonocardia sp. TRM90224 TaxID=2812678 RepID=UPI001E333EA8|nr:Glu/Leu/Phe/Val dehydrogenase dimerization domain-containing protein [Pseudonocardia sp. TRM90224]